MYIRKIREMIMVIISIHSTFPRQFMKIENFGFVLSPHQCSWVNQIHNILSKVYPSQSNSFHLFFSIELLTWGMSATQF